MPAVHSVLFVAASADDVELMESAVRKAGIKVLVRRTETVSGLKQALAEAKWDAIVSDDTLPALDARGVLRIVEEFGADVPVIVVSGAIGGDRAAEIMRAGARDYVVKERLDRLGPAISREVREAQSRSVRREAEGLAEKLAEIVQSASEAIISTTIEGVIASWNPAAERIFGWSAEEALGVHISSLTPSLATNRFRTTDTQRTGKVMQAFESTCQRKDGTTVYVSVTVSAVRDKAGRLTSIAHFARDVTAEKQAALEIQAQTEALRESENRFWTFLQHSPLLAWMTDADGNFSFLKDPTVPATTVDAESVAGKNVREYYPPHLADAYLSQIQQVSETGNVIESYQTARRADGSEGEFLVYRFPVVRRAGPPLIGGVALDSTEKRKTEHELRLRDRAMQAVTQGILITDARQPDNPLIYVSPGFTAITGFTAEEAIGRNCRFLQGPETDPSAVAAIREALFLGKPCRVELLNYRRDGSTFWNELSIAPVSDNEGNISHFVGVQTDVTSRRQLEEHYRHAQKMEAIGRLAGGVAHDFNNLLTVINGYSEVLLQDPSLPEECRTLIELIERAGRSSAQLTRKLLTFSRRQVVKPHVLDLNEILNDVQPMIRSLIGEHITLTTTLDPALECIEADRGDVEQVIMNLVINSRDAMPTGGALQIATRNVPEGEAPVAASNPVRSVTLEITDTGHGMTDEVQRRMFEPFFTTKEAGQGTGLGLSVVHGVIKQNRGDIRVFSQPGRGTKVVVYWPATARSRALDAAGPAQPRAIGLENDRRTVLLVEDEEQVRRFSRQALTGVGYHVIDAEDGHAALEIGRSYDGPIHLLVTDVVMQKMGGPELAAQLAEFHPETRVLFVSGYSDDAVVRHGIRTDSIHFLSKPFSMSALAAMAELVLDRDARHGMKS